MEARTSTVTPPTLAARLRVNQRSLQVALGVLWIIDGLLKFQPNLFHPTFISDVIRPMAIGQPTLVGSAITHMANFLSKEATMWVALFGLVEIAIGVGMLSRRTVKRALVVSFIWGAGVYLFGEGLGMMFTGHTSPLIGAPGAVCFYILLGVMVWPKERAGAREPAGFGSSAAARGVFGSNGALIAWAGIWVIEAILWMLPYNRTGNSISWQMAGTADGEPGWYAHFLTSFGHAFAGAGVWMAVILASTSLIVAIGPFVSRQPQLYVGIGIALALVYWVTGQGLGELLTGSGTDPNNAPVVAMIGLCILPLVPARADASTPAARALNLHPVGVVFSAIAVTLVPLAVAAVPASSEAAGPAGTSTPAQVAAATSSTSSGTASSGTSSSGASMPGMPGMSMGSSSSGNSSSSSHKSMNMAAMAGLGVTKTGWKYTGPALPASEVQDLITSSNRQDAGHKMQTPNCTAQPTAQQVLGATQYVQATSAAVAKYKDLSVALAAGYVPITNTNYPVVHYLNYQYMRPADVMNPNKVDSLVYATTPYGPVLVAAMFLMPGQGDGPMPYGCLVQWHAHTNLCTSDTTHQIDGFTPCPAGTSPDGDTPMMTHVWQVPVAGGPLAIDPSDLQVVEAAIMAQQQGLAPISNGTRAELAAASAN
jgi:hypothetical protein